MEQLNKTAYAVNPDRLIYDGKHPIDATVLTVTLDGRSAVTIKRGQIIDTADGKYSIHAESGEPCAISEETITVEPGTTEVQVQAYISGPFRADAVIASPELTDADVQKLRDKGIYLK